MLPSQRKKEESQCSICHGVGWLHSYSFGLKIQKLNGPASVPVMFTCYCNIEFLLPSQFWFGSANFGPVQLIPGHSTTLTLMAVIGQAANADAMWLI